MENLTGARRPSAQPVRIFAMVALVFAAILPVLASTPPPDEVDVAFRQRNWPKFEQGVLRQAASTHLGGAQVRAMAAAGMQDEAIQVALMALPLLKPTMLLAVVRGLSPESGKQKIVDLAFEMARSNEIPAGLRAAAVAEVALMYADLGQDELAHQALDVSIERTRVESASSSYVSLVGMLVPALRKEVAPRWMLDAVVAHAAEVRDNDDKAAFHRDLADGYFRSSVRDKAIAQLARSKAAAQRIGERRRRRVVLNSIARLAIDQGELSLVRNDWYMDEHGPELAVYYARRGEREKALDFISRLPPDGLYMSHRHAASQAVIRDALERGAVEQAAFYCESLSKYLNADEISARSGLGALQAKTGQMKESKVSFSRAKSLLWPSDTNASARDVKMTLDLALLAHAAGMTEIARDVVLAAVQQTDYVSLKRRKAESPLAQARTSQVLAKLGDRAMALELLSRAWSSIKEVPDDYLGGKEMKAEALLEIAAAAKSLGSQPLGRRMKQSKHKSLNS